MLSYQHIYHAGNRADIHKHEVLSRLLVSLTAKDRPITYFETHAGRGLYDLSAPEAQKTGEAKAGIDALLAHAPLPDAHPYMQALAAVRNKHGAHAYPGSPAIARHLLRAQDVLHLCELHPQEVSHLRAAMKGRNVHIHHRDGYEAVMALCPPIPLRGLAMIDPSYEVKSEYEKAAQCAVVLHRAWPQGVIALWYPMLKAGLHEAMIEDLRKAELPLLHLPHQWCAPDEVRGMYGSGMLLINPPYDFEAASPIALPILT